MNTYERIAQLIYESVLLIERDKENKAKKDKYIRGLGRKEDAMGTKTPKQKGNLQDIAKKAAKFGTEVKGKRPEVGVQAGTVRGVKAIETNLGRKALRNK
jgi:hypothetical protein